MTTMMSALQWTESPFASFCAIDASVVVIGVEMADSDGKECIKYAYTQQGGLTSWVVTLEITAAHEKLLPALTG